MAAMNATVRHISTSSLGRGRAIPGSTGGTEPLCPHWVTHTMTAAQCHTTGQCVTRHCRDKAVRCHADTHSTLHRAQYTLYTPLLQRSLSSLSAGHAAAPYYRCALLLITAASTSTLQPTLETTMTCVHSAECGVHRTDGVNKLYRKNGYNGQERKCRCYLHDICHQLDASALTAATGSMVPSSTRFTTSLSPSVLLLSVVPLLPLSLTLRSARASSSFTSLCTIPTRHRTSFDVKRL